MVSDFLISPCVNTPTHLTRKLLFTGNVLILFFLQVILGFPPVMICETHVGLAGWDFSGDFVCFPTQERAMAAGGMAMVNRVAGYKEGNGEDATEGWMMVAMGHGLCV
jgi:hypothetical protein